MIIYLCVIECCNNLKEKKNHITFTTLHLHEKIYLTFFFFFLVVEQLLAAKRVKRRYFFVTFEIVSFVFYTFPITYIDSSSSFIDDK